MHPALAQLIPAPDHLRTKVSYGLDGVDAAVLAQAEAVIAAMQGDYLLWVEDDLKKIQSLYARASALPIDSRMAAVTDLFGVAHDMKGQGGSFGFPLITEISAQLCRFIERTEVYDAVHLEVLSVHIGAMQWVLANNMQGAGGRDGADLISNLAAIVAKMVK